MDQIPFLDRICSDRGFFKYDCKPKTKVGWLYYAITYTKLEIFYM
jgi:hypothetical protein